MESLKSRFSLPSLDMLGGPPPAGRPSGFPLALAPGVRGAAATPPSGFAALLASLAGAGLEVVPAPSETAPAEDGAGAGPAPVAALVPAASPPPALVPSSAELAAEPAMSTGPAQLGPPPPPAPPASTPVPLEANPAFGPAAPLAPLPAPAPELAAASSPAGERPLDPAAEVADGAQPAPAPLPGTQPLRAAPRPLAEGSASDSAELAPAVPPSGRSTSQANAAPRPAGEPALEPPEALPPLAPASDQGVAFEPDSMAEPDALAALAVEPGEPHEPRGKDPLPVRALAGEVRSAQAVELDSVAAEARRPALGARDAEGLLRQVRLEIRPDLRQATIQLRPPHLGRIAIHVAIVEDGVRASMRVERREALAVLEAHAQELRAMFEQAGFPAAELDLGLDERGPDQRWTSAREDPGRGSEDGDAVPVSDIGRAALGEILARARGGIDTYA